MNVNMNLLDEHFSGSALNFYNPKTRAKTHFSFEPGIATLHRGHIPHAAQPIISGERSNLVFWLYGENGFVPYVELDDGLAFDANTRWFMPANDQKYDRYAPF
ncbi:hypothetical protein HR060_16110 [Catenovulum sp. SM1970]|uniref:hypothetical protein n=1 Tax=Marinifaba aquimaris TaxID=2741323 RepID=UPI0015745D32|nr:hypothetical protein [Marinifaba aquimaris]NTS78377.1 hypothetical protein [Marinifaba aquimaris]